MIKSNSKKSINLVSRLSLQDSKNFNEIPQRKTNNFEVSPEK